MKLPMSTELHRSERIGWLRAAVLGANDGIVSTASLIVGVIAAQASRQNILVAGIAGLVSGAMSMAAGEYVSVSSQADTEQADLAREKQELATDPEFEKEELAQLYIQRGVKPELARQVSEQLMIHDALGTHAREELGFSTILSAKPIQAAFTSAGTFAIGAALPLLLALILPEKNLILHIPLASLFFLMILGSLAAKAGNASLWKGAIRVGFWGALAMILTAIIGKIFGTIV